MSMGKGVIIGLLLGALFKLASVGVSEGIKVEAGTSSSSDDFLKNNCNADNIINAEKLIYGEGLDANNWSWDSFKDIPGSAVTETLDTSLGDLSEGTSAVSKGVPVKSAMSPEENLKSWDTGEKTSIHNMNQEYVTNVGEKTAKE